MHGILAWVSSRSVTMYSRTAGAAVASCAAHPRYLTFREGVVDWARSFERFEIDVQLVIVGIKIIAPRCLVTEG